MRGCRFVLSGYFRVEQEAGFRTPDAATMCVNRDYKVWIADIWNGMNRFPELDHLELSQNLTISNFV